MSGGYAPNGDILVHADSVMGYWMFNYDSLDHLSMATALGNQPTGYAGPYGCWNYDSFGNRRVANPDF